MPDMEKRLEAFVRIGHGIVVFPGGVGTAEAANGGSPAGLDSDLCETTWCAYAWPANYGNTGNRTFFVNQGGDIVATENPAYTAAAGPAAQAAFRVGSAANAITAPPQDEEAGGPPSRSRDAEAEAEEPPARRPL